MQGITVVYPNQEGAKFDFAHFMGKHIPMAIALHGDNIVKYEVRRPLPGLGGTPPPFMCITVVWVRSAEEFLSVATSRGAALDADTANYTNVAPIVHFDEIIPA